MEEEKLYCQATAITRATSPISTTDFRQLILDLRFCIFRPQKLAHLLIGFLNSKTKEFLGNRSMSPMRGKCKRTPSANLDLQPGDIVEIKSKEEILATLDSKGRNRGLGFTSDMLQHCGKRYRVLKKLDRMINERTGKMREIANTVILEEVCCDGKSGGDCKRSCYLLWREIWLRKVNE
jgi:hypothetical protein